MHGEDEDGQVDGDEQAIGFAGAEQYQRKDAGQPWLRAVSPPWHLWGTSQTVNLSIDPPFVTGQAQFTNQLVKVSYGRPETWHWIFVANVLRADPSDVGQDQLIDIQWDLTIGVGRSSSRIVSFDRWFLGWPAGPFPGRLATLFTQKTKKVGIPRNSVGDPEPDEIVDRVTAQEIQLSATVRLGQSGALSPKSAVVEVSAYFAPAVHVRPDWVAAGPPEIKFQGSEIGCK